MELLRNIVRRVFATSSAPYQMLNRALDFIQISRKYGVARYAELMRIEGGSAGELAVPMAFGNLLHPILIRPGTDDTKTVIDNIVREEWGNFVPNGDPKWMIDAGAYIGDTSAYFLSRFPGLNIVALEPDSLTFEFTRNNLGPYGSRVMLHNCGLYIHEGSVRFNSGQTSSAITTDGEMEIPVTTIPSLLAKYSIERLDILKMDIEGAEESIFPGDVEPWLSRVDLLIIEFHSEAGEALITRVLKQYGFSMRRYRSIWYCRKTS